MITTLICIHYAAAIFYAGVYFQDNFEWCETRREKVVTITACLLIILFGASLLFIPLAGFIWNEIDKYFCLVFFVRWYIFGRLLDYSEGKIDDMNMLGSQLGNTLHDRLQKHAIEIVNKHRNSSK